jgi:hypothetical protein
VQSPEEVSVDLSLGGAHYCHHIPLATKETGKYGMLMFLRREKTSLMNMKPISANCAPILDKTNKVSTCMEQLLWYTLIDSEHMNKCVNKNGR